ncbi:glycosyl transferase, group 2 family protein [Stappia aggregata IAM 12614]|uniref:Glycosyl transferase, group 2 family protein n=2 Tax=Roseibium aggregatum TaxID=187304 RepID=A0NMH8_ROSAI|nr:glycosyl transferase, group 2 family protein [Stappia aggregata IAM 12614] [Roseibium aggregatum IAM 12614]
MGKRVRAQNRFRAVFSSNIVQAYNDRIANAVCMAQAKLTDEEIAGIRKEIEGWDEKPLISIVMPVYNSDGEQLGAAVESVRQQIYQDWELCIADDCSTVPQVRTILEAVAAEDRRIKLVFRNTNGHICAASNSALELAEGPFVAFMDHDDPETQLIIDLVQGV